MTSVSTNTEQLNDLIAIINDGQRFYEHASAEVDDSELKRLFQEMRDAKIELIAALSAKVSANEGEPASDGTFAGKFWQVYTDVKALLTKNDASTYVKELEDAEDRILHAFEDALENSDVGMHALLAPEMPKVRACHDRMRDLKKAIEK